MVESVDSLEGLTVFSTFDTISEPWQIDVEEHSCNKTVFTSHHGLQPLATMPIGLWNDPVPLHVAIDTIKSSVR